MQCKDEDDCPTPMWCKSKDYCPKAASVERAPESRPAEARCAGATGSVIAWLSCAQWPDGLLSFAYTDHDNTTRDRHDTEDQAAAVCSMLRREGLGGERIHFPVRTWTEPVYSQNNKDVPIPAPTKHE